MLAKNTKMANTLKKVAGKNKWHYSCYIVTLLGTYLSALKCMKCPVGYYISTNPLDDSSPWRCEDCGALAPSNLAVEVNTRVSNSIKVMEENGLDPETCEKFILIHCRILHPQHAHMLDVKHSWLHLLGHHEGTVFENHPKCRTFPILAF